MEPTPERIAELCRAYIRRRFGHVNLPMAVHIQLGANLEFQSIAVELTAAAAAEPSMGEVHANILRALAESDDKPTGADLAERAGYQFGGRFRTALADLVREGKVVNCRPGYELVREI